VKARVRRRGGPLVAHAPNLDAVAPRLELGAFPTPLTEAPRAAALYGPARVFVKREDLTSPLYGGAKVRAIEFLLGAADAAGATTVATLGPESSHHVYAVARYASAAGFRVRAATFPQPETADGAALRARIAETGVDVVRAPATALLWWAAALARFRRVDGRRPTWIAAGGAEPRGVLGAAEATIELFDDVDAGAAPEPRAIVVPAGSCATAAGVVLGVAVARRATRVIAVRTTPRLVASKGKILRLAAAAARLLVSAGASPELIGRLDAVATFVDHDRAGPGYARPDSEARRALAAAAEDGLKLETTYTAKAFAALSREDLRGEVVCFWHTYSAAAP
jgi:D-cysteine desulfhydrase